MLNSPYLFPFRVIGRFISVSVKTLGTALVTILMVLIITGCIVGSVLTVYVLNAIGAEEEVDLNSIRLGYTSVIYFTCNETGEHLPLQRLYRPDHNRTWVDLEDIPPHVIWALVAVEDRRFWQHEGVDWWRTTGAFVNMLIPFEHTTAGGGSTIHQQLIKNVTGDDALRVDRKVREIFRALNLAQNFTHEQVIEAYLNVVSFGAGANGIQAAAQTYFGKDVGDLTIAEAAAIVGITQFPGRFNPFVNPELHKQRQEDVLFFMYEQGFITTAEYQAALVEPLNFNRQAFDNRVGHVQNWFVDHVIEEVVSDLMRVRGMTRAEAETMLFEGGLRIFATVDMDIQNHLEEFYLTSANFPPVLNEEFPQSAFVILDHEGRIVALVGGVGEKTGNRMFNRATMARRHPGSSIKPIGVYAMAFEFNQAHWSMLVDDFPINPEAPQHQWYPRNFYGYYMRMVTIDLAMQRSINTIPVKLGMQVGWEPIFDFMHDDLQMHSLVRNEVIGGRVFSDMDMGPLALGGMTRGMTPLEMAGAYQIFANGGYFTRPFAYTEVLDAEGRVILRADTEPRRVISPDTAEVMRRILERAVHGPRATGRQGAIPGMPTAGKTGTSSYDVDQWFIGFTPYYIGAVWLGYDNPLTMNRFGDTVPNTIRWNNYPPPIIFREVMRPIHEDLEHRPFWESGMVSSRLYCLNSGRLAGPGCTNTGSGWFKNNFMPPVCNGVYFNADAAIITRDPREGSGALSGFPVDGLIPPIGDNIPPDPPSSLWPPEGHIPAMPATPPAGGFVPDPPALPPGAIALPPGLTG